MKLNMIFKIFLLGCLILGLQLCASYEANIAEEKSLNAEESSSIADSVNGRNPNLKQSDIKWFDRGYNVARGNGFNKEMMTKKNDFGDEGVRDAIFDIDKTKFPPLAGNSYNKIRTPQGFEVMELKGCTNSFGSKTISSSKELKDEFSTGIGVTGSYLGISFSANTDYEKMEKSLNNQEKVYVSNKARCGKYRVLVNFYDPPNPSKNLVSALQKLSGKKFNVKDVKANKDTFYEFIDFSVGTHYVKEYVLGSIFSSTLETSKEQSTNMKKVGLDVKASLSYLSYASFDTSYIQNMNSTLKEFSNKIDTKSYISGSNGKSSKFEDFVTTASDNPDYISIEVKPIMDLLTNEKFKNKIIDSQFAKDLKWTKAGNEYDSIVNELKIAYDNYGSYIGKKVTENIKVDKADTDLTNEQHTPKVNLYAMLEFLDNIPVACPEGSALSYIKLNPDGVEHKYSFMCLKSTGITSECFERQTKIATIEDGKNVRYLDRHYMECEEDQLMTEFALINNSGKTETNKRINYKYKCCNAKVTNCKNFNTHAKDKGINGNEPGCCGAHFLDRFTIDAREEGQMIFGISAFGMTQRKVGNEIRFGYSGKKCQVFPSSEF